MSDKNKRLKAIKEIIKDNRITNQDELLSRLVKQGLSTTQATLSRDLKVLQVGKMPDGKNGYYYSLPTRDLDSESIKDFVKDIIRGYISSTYSQNLCLIFTLPGHAGSVGLALDKLDLDEIAGTIAGDDTVLVIMREGVTQAEMEQCFNKLMSGELEEQQ